MRLLSKRARPRCSKQSSWRRPTERSVAAGALLCLILCLIPALARAQARDQDVRKYNRGLYAYQVGDYVTAIEELRETLYPTPRINDEEVRLAAYQLLGASYFLNADAEAARAEFAQALVMDAEATLDAFIFPPPVVEFYAQIQDEFRRALAGDDGGDDPGGEAGDDKEVKRRLIERRITERIWLLNLLPFGTPQFQNGEKDWGTFFLISQVLALTLNMVSFALVQSLRDDATGAFVGSKRQRAERFQIVQFSSLGAFALLYGWSVTDGILDFRESDEQIIQQEAIPGAEPPPAAPPAVGLKLGFSF